MRNPWRVFCMITLTAAWCGAGTAEQMVITRFNASLEYERSGEYARALEEMALLGSAAEGDYLATLRLGWLNYLNGHYAESQTAYTRANELSGGKSIEAMLGLTLPLAAQEKWNDVEQTYLRILAVDMMQYDANLRLGQIYLNRGEYSKAATYLRLVHGHYPGAYEPNLSLGWTNYYLGKTGDARTCFTRTLMLSPGDSSAIRGLNLLK